MYQRPVTSTDLLFEQPPGVENNHVCSGYSDQNRLNLGEGYLNEYQNQKTKFTFGFERNYGQTNALGLKRSRAGHVSHLTSQYREVQDLLTECRNLDEVIKKYQVINAAFEQFRQIHFECYKCLGDNPSEAEAHNYFETQLKRKNEIDQL